MSEQVHDIATLQAMDDGAWADLQEDYYRRIYFYVKRYVGDHQTAEDLTQDVFLGALRGIKGFDPVLRFARRLLEDGIAGRDELCAIDAKASRVMDEARAFASSSPYPDVSTAFAGAFA